MDVPDAYAAAVREGRFDDAATDETLHTRWRDDHDHVARALLLVAAAHHLTGEKKGRDERVEEILEHAARHLVQAQSADQAVRRLQDHVGQAYEKAEIGHALPPLRLDVLEA